MADFNRKYRNRPMIVGNAAIQNREAHEASAIIQIEDHNGGFLTSRVTTAERDAITNPTNGLMVWNTTTTQMEIYSGGAWGAVGGGGGATTLAALTDTAVGAQTIGQGLTWSGTAWVPADVALKTGIEDITTGNTNIQVTGTGISSDTINFTVGGLSVGSVTTLGGLGVTPKWTFGGIVDPDVFAGNAITTIVRDGTYTFGASSEGFLVYNGDVKEYQYHDGTGWKSIGGTPPTAANAISPAATDATGAIGVLTTEFALEDHKHPAQGVSADAGNVLSVGTDGLHYFAETDEVIENAGTLSGAAPVGAQWGVDTTTGQAYYVAAGNWTAMPVVTVDLNFTVSSQTGSAAGASPLGAPATPDAGDVHLEIYNDLLVWWSWGGATWANSAQTPIALTLASAVSPAATDNLGLVGTSGLAAREDHKHPAQGVSADALNRLTVSATDGLHYYTANNRAFASNTAVVAANTALGTTGNPTVAEMQVYVTATPTVFDTVLYYTGDDTSTSTPTHVYHVDNAGTVTLLRSTFGGVYEAIFNATTDWGTAAGGLFTMTIAAATHMVAAPKTVQTWLDDGTNYILNTVDSVSVHKTTGDVVLTVSDTPNGRFAGRVTIQ